MANVNFSSDEILNFIKQFSKTSEGYSAISKNMKRRRSFVPQWADKKKVRTKSQVEKIANDMADILHRHMISDTQTTATAADGTTYIREGLSKFKREDIHVEVIRVNAEYSAKIYFDASALHRDSLLQTNDGILDIVELFVHGYKDAKASVHGEWHGVEIWTKRNREGNDDFIRNAVAEFNHKYKEKAFATVEEKYIK